MVKSISIALFLFSSCICFSQNSDNRIKETTSATSKTIVGGDTKAPLHEETIGRPVFVDLGTPIIMPYSPSPSPSNDNTDKKTSGNKNTSKTTLK